MWVAVGLLLLPGHFESVCCENGAPWSDHGAVLRAEVLAAADQRLLTRGDQVLRTVLHVIQSVSCGP